MGSGLQPCHGPLFDLQSIGTHVVRTQPIFLVGSVEGSQLSTTNYQHMLCVTLHSLSGNCWLHLQLLEIWRGVTLSLLWKYPSWNED